MMTMTISTILTIAVIIIVACALFGFVLGVIANDETSVLGAGVGAYGGVIIAVWWIIIAVALHFIGKFW
jgi:hypothetical protein